MNYFPCHFHRERKTIIKIDKQSANAMGLEIVRIGNCQNRNMSELVAIRIKKISTIRYPALEAFKRARSFFGLF